MVMLSTMEMRKLKKEEKRESSKPLTAAGRCNEEGEVVVRGVGGIFIKLGGS